MLSLSLAGLGWETGVMWDGEADVPAAELEFAALPAAQQAAALTLGTPCVC